jgi:hypothetical protein
MRYPATDRLIAVFDAEFDGRKSARGGIANAGSASSAV